VNRGTLTRLTGLYKLRLLMLAITFIAALGEAFEGRLDWYELGGVILFEVLVLGLGHFLVWHIGGRR
jgi:hypothetical protein